MKKQLILVGSVFITALLLFGAYIIFFNNEPEETVDPFYTLSDAVKSEIEKVKENIDIVFSGTNKSKVESDESLNLAYNFALSYTKANKKIDVSFDENGSYYGIIIKKGTEQKQISFDELFKVKEDSTKYAFDGERMYTNAILSLYGKSEIDIELKALEGFTTWGDTTLNGAPLLFESLNKDQIQTVIITNESGSYKIYRNTDNQLVFDGAEIINYNAELFANLLVNVRLVVSSGIVENPHALSEYRLDSEENALGMFKVTATDKTTHKVLIGNKTPDGSYYYAKYSTKEFIYLIPVSYIETTILQPVTSYLTANLVAGISSAEEINSIDNIVLDFLDQGLSLKAVTYAKLFTSSNIKAYKETDIVNAFINKIKFSGAYTNWTETSTLGGFTSSDGKSVYLEVPLANYGSVGDYKVSFGLLKDETYFAVTPKKISAKISLDGDTFTDIDIGNIEFSQGNKELKTYSFNFHSVEPVQYVRVYFEFERGKYIVLDELSVFVDGIDAHPDDGMVGGWKLISPSEYIPEGKNYIYPNYNFASDFAVKITTLVGESVVDYAITSKPGDAETLIEEKLEKYDLLEPAYHVSYEYKGITSEVFFSHINENGKYYCYSVLSGESGDKKINLCTDIIAEVSLETAPWLNWEMVDYVEQSILSMHIDTINTLAFTFDNKTYTFTLERNEKGKLSRATIDGKEVDLQNFRYLYISILEVYIKGEYHDNGESKSEFLKINIDSTSKDQEIIFYRVTTSKAYYTIDGQGMNYVLIDSINTIKTNLSLLLAGEEIPHRK
ncbi:MAG: hypothetical protein A2Y15_01010 [Clostridiales bacterium GWF2_36_10]|nr:MAG: hypothetical protein A2Y15_01010 [Clostridiales bacterium GWF2_36_10]HAN20561.1 hypothetical protein [Clostridiales bacterium]